MCKDNARCMASTDSTFNLDERGSCALALAGKKTLLKSSVLPIIESVSISVILL